MMIVIRGSLIPNLFSVFSKIDGVTLYPFVFVRKGVTPQLLNHEHIHVRQVEEILIPVGLLMLGVSILAESVTIALLAAPVGVACYYILYLFEFVSRLTDIIGAKQPFQDTFNQAYRASAFEKEAYNHQNDLNYIVHRRPFAWIYED